MALTRKVAVASSTARTMSAVVAITTARTTSGAAVATAMTTATSAAAATITGSSAYELDVRGACAGALSLCDTSAFCADSGPREKRDHQARLLDCQLCGCGGSRPADLGVLAVPAGAVCADRLARRLYRRP